jgi:hypothetical protein
MTDGGAIVNSALSSVGKHAELPSRTIASLLSSRDLDAQIVQLGARRPRQPDHQGPSFS